MKRHIRNAISHKNKKSRRRNKRKAEMETPGEKRRLLLCVSIPFHSRRCVWDPEYSSRIHYVLTALFHEKRLLRGVPQPVRSDSHFCAQKHAPPGIHSCVQKHAPPGIHFCVQKHVLLCIRFCVLQHVLLCIPFRAYFRAGCRSRSFRRRHWMCDSDHRGPAK